MSIFEYDEEKHMKCERAEWREIGQNDLANLLKSLMDAGRTEDINHVIYDSDYRAKLLKEYLQE